MVPHGTHPVRVGGWGSWDKGPGSREGQSRVKLKDCRSALQDHVLPSGTKSRLQPSGCQTPIHLHVRQLARAMAGAETPGLGAEWALMQSRVGIQTDLNIVLHTRRLLH